VGDAREHILHIFAAFFSGKVRHRLAHYTRDILADIA
jgi:hypothetical protein